jgi:ATP-binding cassette, subfamily C (CFTR/MRP), member 1
LITFGAFAIMRMLSSQSTMSISTAVTSLSILNLITNPARRLLFTVAVGLQAFGSFARIQTFLLLGKNVSEDPKETHGLMDKISPNSELSELSSVPQTPMTTRTMNSIGSFIKPEVASLLGKCFVPGTITAVTGPTGCGTSTILRSLLPREKETNLPLASDDIAYCSQTPWIHEGNVRDNIIGQSDWDVTRYDDVVQSCELDFDLKRMSEGEFTKVGSMGLSLSGGQKQRIVSFDQEQCWSTAGTK